MHECLYNATPAVKARVLEDRTFKAGIGAAITLPQSCQPSRYTQEHSGPNGCPNCTIATNDSLTKVRTFDAGRACAGGRALVWYACCSGSIGRD
jgi:hypothetical protein